MDQPDLNDTGSLLSLSSFKSLTRGLFVLCFVALSIRAGIRFACFRKLFVEDYLMILALGFMLANAVLCQLRMDLVYLVDAVGNGDIAQPPDFDPSLLRAVHAQLVNSIFCALGIWVVKYNFLIFFYRLGSKVRRYRIALWVVVAVTTACLGVALGTQDYLCTTSSIEFITTHCGASAGIKRQKNNTIVNTTLDVLTDVLIIVFPIVILWRVRIPLRRKIVLACFFGMVLLKVAITLVRVALTNSRLAQNMDWIWFWFTVEFVTGEYATPARFHLINYHSMQSLIKGSPAFFVACTASFRSLFTQLDRSRNGIPLENQANAARRPSISRSPKRRFQDTILNTILTLEGGAPNERDSYLLDTEPPSYRSSGDDRHESRWSGPTRAESDRAQSITDTSYTGARNNEARQISCADNI
ncbi:hypothetical protein PG984_008394 [Apiospora sp. TS-2023a]